MTVLGCAHVGGPSELCQTLKILHSVIVSTSPWHKARYGYADVDPPFSKMGIGMHTNADRKNPPMTIVGPAVLGAAVVVLVYNASPVSNKVNQNDMHFPTRAVLHVYN